MKFCPFLVAGQSMLLPQSGDPKTSGGTPLNDRFEAQDNTLNTERDTAAVSANYECLGEPCRFFHAGGCRFDALFETRETETQQHNVLGVGGETEEASVLDEVWSLQRESLREVMAGFHKLQAAQDELEKSLTGRVETQVTKIETQVSGIDTQMRDTQTALGKLGARVEPLHEMRDAVGRELETLQNQVRQLETAFRAELGEFRRSLQGLNEFQEFVQSTLRDSTSSVETIVQNGQSENKATLSNTQSAVEKALESSQSILSSTLEKIEATIHETRTQLGTLLAASTTDARSQLERGLAMILEELTTAEETRDHLRSALDDIVRETQEVGVVTRRVESSQVLTQELMDEQRGLGARIEKQECQERARLLNNAGVLSYHQGAYDTSIERFQKAVEVDPNLAEAFNNLGLSYTEMGREEEASEAFHRALETNPSMAQAYNNMGYLYFRKGDLEHAVEMYQRAIQRGADTSAAYSNLANAYYKMKRFDDAVTTWKKALEVDPGNTKALAALERMGLESQHA